MDYCFCRGEFVAVSTCLSICVSAGLLKKLRTIYHEIFTDRIWPRTRNVQLHFGDDMDQGLSKKSLCLSLRNSSVAMPVPAGAHTIILLCSHKIPPLTDC